MFVRLQEALQYDKDTYGFDLLEIRTELGESWATYDTPSTREAIGFASGDSFQDFFLELIRLQFFFLCKHDSSAWVFDMSRISAVR